MNRSLCAFPLVGRDNEALLVWTTTPWTLDQQRRCRRWPRLDLCQGQHEDGWTYYLAEEAAKQSLIGKWETVWQIER